MTPFSIAQLHSLQALGHEQHGVEYKRSGKLTTKRFAAKVIRAMLAMSNNRDGGIVVIGVEDVDGEVKWSGVHQDDNPTWTYDNLADKVTEYADPNVSFELTKLISNGNNFIIITIKKFDETPTFCKKEAYVEGDQILRKGALYIRPRHKAESIEIASSQDMRDIISLTTDIRYRDFMRDAQSASLLSVSSDLDTAENIFKEERDSI